MALIAVAVISIGSSVTYVSSKHLVKKAQEDEIIFQGMAYYRAIQSFYNVRSPHAYPRRLEDLIRDPRYLYLRHIRSLYKLPNGDSWQPVVSRDGHILGVYFDSDRGPLRKSGFIKELQHFEQAKSYKDWKFTYLPNSSK